MATLDFKPPRTKAEPELNLLLPKSAEQPLWKSLFQNLDDYFFPKKQPPLVLTSKPVPVKDIWGFYDYKKSGVVGSTVVHILTIAAIVRSEEHTSELQSQSNLVCRLLLEKKKKL